MHIAVNRFIVTKQTTDVSDALRRLLYDDLLPHALPSALVDPNAFRQRYCCTPRSLALASRLCVASHTPPPPRQQVCAP